MKNRCKFLLEILTSASNRMADIELEISLERQDNGDIFLKLEIHRGLIYTEENFDDELCAELYKNNDTDNEIAQQDCSGFNCAGINGNLYMRMSSVDAIEDLECLEEDEDIAFTEELSELKALDSLTNLERVIGTLISALIPSMISLDGLSDLEQLGGDFILTDHM